MTHISPQQICQTHLGQIVKVILVNPGGCQTQGDLLGTRNLVTITRQMELTAMT